MTTDSSLHEFDSILRAELGNLEAVGSNTLRLYRDVASAAFKAFPSSEIGRRVVSDAVVIEKDRIARVDDLANHLLRRWKAASPTA